MIAKVTYRKIEVPLGDISLKGRLKLVDDSKGIVLFSHGKGSNRLSVRNNYVAELLVEHGFSSLLFDLLTPLEAEIQQNRVNLELLTKRLLKVTEWVRSYHETKHLPIAYFGSSSYGAASALKAVSKLGDKVKAVVSRGGRPDLVMDVLKDIKTPTLFLVGSNDEEDIVESNKKILSEMNCIHELSIIGGASHLFEESGKMEDVTEHTVNWFDKYLHL
ncbi:dienelactone hydrolase family protein [Lutibacter sp. B1]|uniref:dienelactone hydrolase family protein n=1 Tax=Lutibacter sp. B1 TaxID=2725996 RepID=UPI0014569450|nr:dienelactone hydrolase family protein [Lutibacter sp. B1]NLP57078.1 dienelactone hydrolase family protein [Lutibacter sp. B1]